MNRRLKTLAGMALAVTLAGAAAAQSSFTPTQTQIADSRLAVSTLVREDIFAGFLAKDMTSLARGEANLAKLYDARPNARGEVRSWQAGAAMYRAVLAREAGDNAGYARLYAQAMTWMDEADKTVATEPAVSAIGGGIGVLFADKLAPSDRAAYWQRSYAYYQGLTNAQAPVVANLPPHMKGEGLAGLAVSAQRTGRQAEAEAALDKLIPLAKGTAYEAPALKWKSDPASRATTSLTCLSCHDDGRLAPSAARLATAPPA